MSIDSSILRESALRDASDLLRAPPSGAVVRFEELTAWHAGDAFLKEAEQVLNEAKAAAQTELMRAKADGYASGYEEGVREATALIANTKAAVEEYYKGLGVTLTDLVVKIVKEILDDVDPAEAVVSAVRKALKTTDLGSDVTLSVSPAVIDTVYSRLSEFVGNDTRFKIALREDPGLGPTNCRLISEFGTVDLSLYRQLDLLAESLRSTQLGLEA